LGLTAQTRTMGVWSGAVGATGRLTPTLSVSADVSRGWRAPTDAELYAHGRPVGTRRFDLGTRDLEPERGLGIEGAVEWRWRMLRAAATGFLERIDDYIDR